MQLKCAVQKADSDSNRRLVRGGGDGCLVSLWLCFYAVSDFATRVKINKLYSSSDTVISDVDVTPSNEARLPERDE